MSIRRNYDPFFKAYGPGPDQRVPYWKAVQAPEHPTVVLHPNLYFDPGPAESRQRILLEHDGMTLERGVELFRPVDYWRARVLHETFALRGNFLGHLDSFARTVERAMRLTKDESLWDDTGFWTLRRGRDCYLGLSEAGAEELGSSLASGSLVFVLSNPGQILVVTAPNAADLEVLEVDAYHNNQYSPLVESMRGLRRGLDAVGLWELKGSVEEDLERIEGPALRQRSSSSWKPSTFTLEPVATVESERGYHCGILTSGLRAVLVRELPVLGGVLPTPLLVDSRYWLGDEDLSRDPLYYVLQTKSYILRTCIVLDIVIDSDRELRSWD